MKKLTLYSLILMIFTSVYGFANMPRAFFLMGYGSIAWYLLGAIAFFLPYAFMMAEYGSAFKNEKGGIFSWMQLSVGPKYAFIGTFMWYSSYIIWQVNVSSSLWVPLSNAIYGRDITGSLRFMGLEGPRALGILGIGWIILVTFVASFGVDRISKITSIGGIAVTALNLVLLIGGIITLILNDGALAQPINDLAQTLTVSPNPNYQSKLSLVSFFTFAIFAYGGIEVIGGLVDQTENPSVTFPKGVAFSAIIIALGYATGIFMIGTFINWESVLSNPGVNNANITYVVMNNLGYTLATGFGYSTTTAIVMGEWCARFVGISMFLALTGAFFTLTYAPLKQLIEGTPKGLWPSRILVMKRNMPVNAMWTQATIVIAFILLVSFGGKEAAKFFDKLITMTNVAMTLPYMFLSAAFPFFKRKKNIEKPFEVYKSYGSALFASIVVTCSVGIANVISIIEPAIAKGLYVDSLLSGGGPIFFALVAFGIYSHYENKTNNPSKPSSKQKATS
ncbi:MAG: glutamate/gamma-aminobutyrate family transporter YjeM [Candidatus Epulonipiscium fishelsonii]|nr:MAG: glutamate/gamma-aminobutyrate family transporter YjeM [Epulopiscium sp. AS2M-Bin002]